MAVIFVGGSQRTGTSIAQQMLCQLPSANPYIYEANFLRQLVQCYADAKNNFGNSHESYFGDVSSLRGFSAGVVLAFLEQTKKRLGGCEHLVLKEPHLTMLWPALAELVADAKFVLMVRDPRDVIASMVQVGEKQQRLGQNYIFARRDIPQLCRHFLSFYAPALSCQDTDFRSRLGVARYEELATDPAQALRGLARFTGLPFDEVDVTTKPTEGMVSTHETRTNPQFSPWVTELNGQALSTSRIGRHVDVLTPDETEQIETLCGEFFSCFNYQPTVEPSHDQKAHRASA